MQRRFSAFLFAATLVLASVSVSRANTVYTSDTTLSDFTSGVTYAEFVAGPNGDITAPVTPTTADVDAGLRIYGDDLNSPVIAQFASATDSIRVFANIDHPGSSYDGYQYSIFGSNDGVNYTELYDVLTVTGSGEPFTLGTFSGTAPTTVDNVIFSGIGNGQGPSGSVGYIADFTFSQAYSYYKFGASTFARESGNTEPEFSGIGTVPEPGTLALFLVGAVGLLVVRRRRIATE